jgi:hypothetical protein
MPTGLNYKSMFIVNDDSRVINKFETSLTDDTRVVIYDRNMFKVNLKKNIFSVHEESPAVQRKKLHENMKLDLGPML